MNVTIGVRTLLATLFAETMLLAGLALLSDGQRGAAYGAFSLAVVGVATAFAGKASIEALAQGGGIQGAKDALLTSAKPGEPPAAP
jgi:hypothetical protein